MAAEIKTKITIVVKGEHYAFDALKVRNILELSRTTKIPNAKEFILGVINLHGNIIPVADFGLVLGKGSITQHKECAILVVSPDDAFDSQLGFLVEEVKEVFEIKDDQILPSVVHDGAGLVESFEGTLKHDGEFVQLINIDALISVLEK